MLSCCCIGLKFCMLSTYRFGFILGGAGIFVLLMPWMDRNRERRLEEERKIAEQALSGDGVEKKNSKSIVNKVEELNLKVSSPTP